MATRFNLRSLGTLLSGLALTSYSALAQAPLQLQVPIGAVARGADISTTNKCERTYDEKGAETNYVLHLIVDPSSGVAIDEASLGINGDTGLYSGGRWRIEVKDENQNFLCAVPIKDLNSTNESYETTVVIPRINRDYAINVSKDLVSQSDIYLVDQLLGERPRGFVCSTLSLAGREGIFCRETLDSFIVQQGGLPRER